MPLRRELTHGFAYWDCRVDDARLVVLNARAAADRGAVIETRTRVRAHDADGGEWRIALARPRRRARGAGARAGQRGGAVGARRGRRGRRGRAARRSVRLVKGSHIVVPRIAGADDAYLCQSADGRVVFAIPYEERFTLIGTTEIALFRRSRPRRRSAPRRRTICSSWRGSSSLSPPARADIVWSYAGVRPLYDDDSRAMRRR